MNKIRTHFEQTIKLSDRDWEIFSSRLQKQSFRKKELLLKQGQIENYLSFIDSGIVRHYIPAEENDLTFAFTFSNNFVSAYDSFLNRRPSDYQIEALTALNLWRIAYTDLQEIYRLTETGDKIGRFAAEDLFMKKSKREISLLNESAEKRYLNLFKEQPQLIREIPLKYIASYIGITPQALSRIRRRIS